MKILKSSLALLFVVGFSGCMTTRIKPTVVATVDSACSTSPGGACYAGPGGPMYAGPGGPLYAGPGGACYAGPGGACQATNDANTVCPAICKPVVAAAPVTN